MNIDELHNKLAEKDWLIEDLTEVDYLLIAHVKEIMEEQLVIPVVSSSVFKDELIKKTESMIWFARENYNKEYYEGVLNAMRNLQVHINKIHKKHYL